MEDDEHRLKELGIELFWISSYENSPTSYNLRLSEPVDIQTLKEIARAYGLSLERCGKNGEYLIKGRKKVRRFFITREEPIFIAKVREKYVKYTKEGIPIILAYLGRKYNIKAEGVESLLEGK